MLIFSICISNFWVMVLNLQPVLREETPQGGMESASLLRRVCLRCDLAEWGLGAGFAQDFI